ncbi:cupin domain-containing protein [Neptuniibacter sp. QD37_6]|uniref:cupin domain-containing protein n=1 Tax=Neptuniibacter sp. QD37_6 TaxID=3398210 RepID=UPI0039F5A62B
MKNKKSIYDAIILVLVILFAPKVAIAHQVDGEIERQLLSSSALPNLPGHKLTSMIVEFGPGSSAPAHRHDAFLFVYVLSGSVLSQLNQDEAIVYHAGDSWVESPTDIHTQTTNMSETETTKLLVVFIAEERAKLSSSRLKTRSEL